MPSVVSPEILASIKRLHLAGRYVDAWNLAKELPPPEEWEDIDARMNASALIARLGDRKRSTRMVFKAWRDPRHRPAAREDMFWEVVLNRGDYLAWQWLQKNLPGPGESAERQADHHSRLVVVLMKLRDFERAAEALEMACSLQPGDRYLTILKADLLLQQGCQEEALDLVQEVIEAEPDYVAAIDMAAEILVDLGEDEAALELLERSLNVVQAGSLARTLATLQMERLRHEEAARTLCLYEKLMPLKDQACVDWLAGVRCDLASRELDLPMALHWARQVKADGFHSKLVARLEAGPAGEWHRVLLPVPHVQEDDLTGGLAALASLAAFWGRKAEHLEQAEEICHDGTPPFKDRAWAEAAGWAVREFRVTMESAETLIDAGMPFILNTVQGGAGHPLVVTGYDGRRPVFFIRDPEDRNATEFLASESLAEQAPYGPRGLVMVPAEHRGALATLDLPESEAFHRLHQVAAALAVDNGDSAAKALRSLHARHPGHTLFWRGELEVARHDGDLPRQLNALEALLEMHPAVEHWQTSRLRLMDRLQGCEAVVSHLTTLCAQPDTHLSHQLMLVQILRRNDQHLDQARRLLRQVLRQHLSAEAIFCEASLLAKSQRHEEALELHRLASCLESGDEEYAMAYFDAALLLQREEEALHHLRQRFEGEGGRSSQPGTTLYQALEKLNQIQEALAVLDQSLALNEDDADHAVYVAGEMVAWNRLDRAREILSSVTRAARAASWHRVQAHLAAVMGDRVAELKHQRAVLKDRPQDVQAHRAIATLLDAQDGRPKGLKFLQKACSQHAFHWHLHMTWLDWARDAGAKESEKVARELLRIDPQDAWTLRELANILSVQKRYQEAHAELDKAAEIDSQNVSQLTVRGSVLEREGRQPEAREFFSQAVCTDVDNVYAMEALMRLSQDDEQRLQGLRVIQRELRRQVTQGDAVTKFTLLARPLMDPAELGRSLGELHARRPDLWQTASCFGDHLRQTGRAEEAVAVTAEAVRRFGMLPRVWMDHSQNLEAAGRRAEGIEAAENIRSLNPGWAGGMRHLSEMLRNERRFQEAREVLEESLRRDSQDSLTHGWLAEVLWDLQEQEGALHHIARAVELSPDYDWAWDMLSRWRKAAGKADALRQALEKLQTQRPDDPGTWKMTARKLDAQEDLPARLAAVDKAISLDPESWDTVDLKAQILADAGRFDEALAVCRSHPSQALELRHREGWLLRQKGRNAEAVAVIEAAVAVDPRFEWPWRLLAIWHEKDGRLDAAEEACRTLIRLEPDNAGHFSRLGGVLVAQMRHPEAETAYAEAWNKAPHDDHPFQRLFWLRVEDDDWADAEALLHAAEGRFTEINLQSRWFVLHCRQRRWKKAGESLDRMLAQPTADDDAVERVHQELRLLPEEVVRRQLKAHEARLVEHLGRKGVRNPGCAKLYRQICVLLNKKPDPALLGVAV